MIDVINGTEVEPRGFGGAVGTEEENQEGKDRVSCNNQVVKYQCTYKGMTAVKR